MLRDLFLASLLAYPTAVVGQQTVTYEDSGREWAERYVSIPSAEFSPTQLRELALHHLRTFDRQKLVKIAIATNAPDLFEIRRGEGMFDYSYKLWADILAERQRQRGPLAVAIRIGRNAVLKIRDAGGATSEMVLDGESPLILAGPGGRADILHVGFSKVPQEQKMQTHVYVFLRTTSRLSIPEAESVVRVLNQRVGIRERLFILLREDAWFIENEFFPVSDPFGQAAMAPSSRQYVCIPTISCMCTGGRVSHCRDQGYLFGKCQ